MEQVKEKALEAMNFFMGKLSEGTECTEAEVENLFDCMGAADNMRVVLRKNIGDIKKALEEGMKF